MELATESAIARFDLPHEFSAAALREAQAFGDKVDPREAESRVDLRDLPLVTIDGDDAKDFDDAVYAEPHAQGFRLIVAIADVSHYVRPGTALDAGAVERGTSVYFPTRVVPMLPHALSDHLCSLAPNVDRLCFVADMIVTKQGALKSATFYPGGRCARRARLTYTLANAALFEGKPAARDAARAAGRQAAWSSSMCTARSQGARTARRAGVRCGRSRVRHRFRRAHAARSSCACATMRTGSSRNA